MIPASEIYDEVINSVIESSREDFADETDDFHVLEELKHLWRSKLFGNDDTNKISGSNQEIRLPHLRNISLSLSYRRSNTQTDNAECKNFTIKVPVNFDGDSEIVQKLSGDVIRKIVILPQPLASKVLQEFVDTVILPQGDGSLFLNDSNLNNEGDNCKSAPDLKASKVLQTDGAGSSNGSTSSSPCSSQSSSSVDDGDNQNKDDEGGAGSNELNSDDDVSEEESDGMETDNVIVCQYEKVMRRANRWRFVLKSGVLKLDGEDFVFGKAFGSGEW